MSVLIDVMLANAFAIPLCAAQRERWVRPPGSHPVTLTERDHLLGFIRSQTGAPFVWGDAVTSGDQRPTFPAKDANLLMGVVSGSSFQERSAIVAICLRAYGAVLLQAATPCARLLSQNPPWANRVIDCHQPSPVTNAKRFVAGDNSVKILRSET